jgi:hypothetical protein
MSSAPFERPFVLPAVDPGGRIRAGAATVGAGLALTSPASLGGTARTALLIWAAVCLLIMLREWRLDLRAGRACWRPGYGWGIARGGEIEPAAVDRATRVYPTRVVLALRAASGGVRRYDLARDDMSPAAHRRLRVLLRLGRG